MRKEKKLAVQLDIMNEQIRNMLPQGHIGKKSSVDATGIDMGGNEGRKRQGNVLAINAENGDDDKAPNDLKYLFKENRDGLDSPRLDLPAHKEKLFVTKPIGPYEPYVKNMGSRFNPNPDDPTKPRTHKPNSHTVMRDCNQELDGEMMKRIQTGPKSIDFGVLFVNSDTKKWFYILNELKGAIAARLIITHENLQLSYQKPQILLSGQDAGFCVNFRSSNTGDFSHIISYIINEKHTFKFMVKALVIPVNLKLSSSLINLRFGDESLEMETSQTVVIENTGNSNAHYSWFSPNLCFKVNPMEGIAGPHSTTSVSIIYMPMAGRSSEEETLNMKIKDGEPKDLRVIATVNETKCEVSPQSLNFGCLAVAQKSTIILLLKNTNPKCSAIFQVDIANLPPNIDVKPVKGRVLPDNTEKLEVTYCSKQPDELRSKDFQIKIRGSKSINVPVSAKTIIPKLLIYEGEFDFGTVTYGNSSNLTMTLENASPIPAQLNLDLRDSEGNPDSEGLNCLKIRQIKSNDDETMILEEKEAEEIQKEQEELKFDDPDNLFSNDLSEDQDDEDSGDSFIEQTEDKSNYFVISLKPTRVYHFELNFTPLQPRQYKYRLPLSLSGFGKLDSLTRPVICHGIAPQFLLEPLTGIIQFPKKTIPPGIEALTAEYQTMSISNPDPRTPLIFFIDCKALEKDLVFNLTTQEGIVDPGCTTEITISFKPVTPGIWEAKLPLYLNEDRFKPKSELTLKGESANPRILFDRREIILPIVPLGFESKCVFRVINDGYQSINLTATVSDDFGSIPLNIHFPDGSNLGINKGRLKVEASFKSNRPLSFTTRIDFEDDLARIYSLYCSGTADNCLLTSWPFFTRNPDCYALNVEPGKPLGLKDVDTSIDSTSKENMSVAFSKVNSSSGKTAQATLGYSPIP
jgi:hypothetical protein